MKTRSRHPRNTRQKRNKKHKLIQTSKRKTRQQTKKKQGGANVFAKISRPKDVKDFKNDRTYKVTAGDEYINIIKYATYFMFVLPIKIDENLSNVEQFINNVNQQEELTNQNQNLSQHITKDQQIINSVVKTSINENSLQNSIEPTPNGSDSETNPSSFSSDLNEFKKELANTQKIYNNLPKDMQKPSVEFTVHPEYGLYSQSVLDKRIQNKLYVSDARYIKKGQCATTSSTANKDCISNFFTVILLFYSVRDVGKPTSTSTSSDNEPDIICVLRLFFEENFSNMFTTTRKINDDSIKKGDIFYDYEIIVSGSINKEQETKDITEKPFSFYKENANRYTTISNKDDLHAQKKRVFNTLLQYGKIENTTNTI